MSNLDRIFKVPLSGGGLILCCRFHAEFTVHWRDGRAGSAWTGLRWSPGPMVLAANSRDPVKPYSSPETLTENTTKKAPGHSLLIKATRSHSQSLRNLHKISSWGLEWVLVLRRHFPVDGCTHSDEKTALLIVLGGVVCSFLKCSVEVAWIKQRTLGLHACYLNGWIQI